MTGERTLAALQPGYSLFSREVEAELLPTCRELGITLGAYSPIGRALLAGGITTDTAFGGDDLRSGNPRFSAANRAANLALVDRLRALADELGVTPAQLALAWLLARGAVPIPGTTSLRHLADNAAATAITLTPEQLGQITDLIPADAVQGERLSPSAARWVGK
ncbi:MULTISPECIES: aldo/keto reductase [Micromonospora]|uniref:aldo/keto reductase n=1 Tax=Micromonospora TaxID=1873 RepID=UPI00131A0F53|nr:MULTISPECIES: aldo/keto reductase [Micromonospora]NES13070.1 aldo/keto reductase [Micromonospora sp. PPF5-17B]NES38834.1 aldo/keto reductase [Micromonospora solifontis]NES54995.1 aldo/keto reductase [Micromonospora sp. PPF5-6]